MLGKILEAGHNATKKHWIVYTILTFVPTIWFSLIINFFGQKWGLIAVDENGIKEFTVLGMGLTLVVIAFPLIISTLNNWYASKSEISELEKLHNEKIFYEQLNKSVDYICEDKLKRLSNVVHNTAEGNKNPPDIVSNPANQLKRILEEINECLCVFMSQPDNEYKHKDFFITLAYRFPKEDEHWKWLDKTEERGLSLEKLTDLDSKTTFNYVIKNDKPYYFNNRKEDAKQEDKYVYDSIDEVNAETGKPIGSIFCCRFQTKKDGKVYAEALVSVSTTKKRFYNGGDKNPKVAREKEENIKDNLLLIVKDYFGKRIGIELNLLYLETMRAKNNSGPIISSPYEVIYQIGQL